MDVVFDLQIEQVRVKLYLILFILDIVNFKT